MHEMRLLLPLLTTLLLTGAPLAAQDEAPPEEPAPMEKPAGEETAEEPPAPEPPTPDPHAADRQAILDLIEAERQAYLDEDAAAVVALYADEVVSVASGRVFTAAREDLQASVEASLDRVDYLEVEMLDEPLMRFSPDGQMAWVVIRQRIRRSVEVSEVEAKEGELTFAGAATYEKRDQGWVKTSSVSTFGR